MELDPEGDVCREARRLLAASGCVCDPVVVAVVGEDGVFDVNALHADDCPIWAATAEGRWGT